MFCSYFIYGSLSVFGWFQPWFMVRAGLTHITSSQVLTHGNTHQRVHGSYAAGTASLEYMFNVLSIEADIE